MDFHIFFSDASFDATTKISIAGIKNLTTNNQYQIINHKAKNSTDAEIFSLYQTLDIAQKTGCNNVVFICDNKNAVNQVRKEFMQKEELRSKFWYAQFLWLPRDYLDEADFLSKNINQEMADSLQEIKNHNKTAAVTQFGNKHLNNHINDIKPEFDNSIINNRIVQFRFFQSQYPLQLQSSFFNKLDIKADFFEEIDAIENDLKLIKKTDAIFGLVAQNIFDMVISI